MDCIQTNRNNLLKFRGVGGQWASKPKPTSAQAAQDEDRRGGQVCQTLPQEPQLVREQRRDVGLPPDAGCDLDHLLG